MTIRFEKKRHLFPPKQITTTQSLRSW